MWTLKLGLALPMAAFAVVVVAAGALADTPISHGGKVGKHHLVDTKTKRGVTCQYDNTGTLSGFNVRAPIVFARDVTSARDHQQVGWQFFVRQQAVLSRTLTTVYTQPLSVMKAYDNSPAPFDNAAADVAFTPAPGDRYFVYAKMFWYGPHGAVQGKAVNEYDFYLEVMGSQSGKISSCPAEYLN